MSDPKETDAFHAACNALVERIRVGEITRESLEDAKREVCSEYGSPAVPQNTDLLDHARDCRDEVIDVLQRKPMRTASGVSPIAIMTSPHMCPHGKCLYCPGGPASEFSSAQAYTGNEPAAARAEKTAYDPYKQTTLRLEQLRKIGHPVDKAELIVMGGTMTARSHDYQTWFVKRALQAMNEYDTTRHPTPSDIDDITYAETDEWAYLEDVKTRNETADVRCIGITFETKPDWCDPEQINRMLDLGVTKVEVGVQTTYEEINRAMHRGHGRKASVDANRRLRDSAFKVGFHMMPGQPGMTREMSLTDFDRLFNNPEWKPDYLKIYPTLVVEGTRVYDQWHQGEYDPLTSDEAADLIADIKRKIPKYCRLQRVQRDIPADYIDAGVQKSNLRELAEERLHERGGSCDCIRCREVGMNDDSPSEVSLDVMRYYAAGGLEHFISLEDPNKDLLIGFCRLRFPNTPVRRELSNAALLRELHVYGNEVSIGSDDDGYQHQGFGRRLMEEAERITANGGYEKLSVIAGIGAREYYRSKLGYWQDGPYVSTYVDPEPST